MKLGLLIFINKLVTKICRLFKKNGSVYPGYIIYDVLRQKKVLEKIKYPKFVIAVTGSSGKGSTTELVNYILTKKGYDVCYNKNGSNGVLAATTLILNNCNLKGEFLHEVLLLECDERHLKLIFGKNKMTHLIITNMTRDQPARHGNYDVVFGDVLKGIGNNTTLIINADDPLVNRLKFTHKNEVIRYGMAKTKDSYIGSNADLTDYAYCPMCNRKLEYKYYHYGHIGNYQCPNCDFGRGKVEYEATDIDLKKQKIKINGELVNLDKNVLYAVYYTLAAYTLCSTIGVKEKDILSILNNNKHESKRGKVSNFDGRTLLSLESKNENNLSYYQTIKYIADQKGKKTIVLGFNNVSRRHPHNDVSWLWDIKFELLNDKNIDKFFCIGKFRYDVAARLSFAGIDIEKIVLVEDMETLPEEIKNKSIGDIYTMCCIELTNIIKNMLEDDENGKD